MTDLSTCEPCPFCGTDGVDDLTIRRDWRHESYGVEEYYNVCCACGAAGPDADTPEEAIERWNKRKEK